MSGSAIDSTHAGKGAYRKDSGKYIGVIVNERRQRVGVDGFAVQYGIRSSLGGLIFLEKEQVEVGEPEEPAGQGADGAPAAPQAKTRLPGVRTGVQRMRLATAPGATTAAAGAPTAVKVVGGLWVALAALMFIGSTLGLLMHFVVSSAMDEAAARGVVLDADGGGTSFLEFLCIAQFAAALLGLVASVRFLQCRAWARGALEFLTWTGIVVLAVSMWLARAHLIGGSGGLAPGTATAITGLIALAGAIPALVLIYYLRSDAVRDAMIEE